MDTDRHDPPTDPVDTDQVPPADINVCPVCEGQCMLETPGGLYVTCRSCDGTGEAREW